MARAGYDTCYLNTLLDLNFKIKDTPPHILIFETASLTCTVKEFFSGALEVSPEIRFISISPSNQFQTLSLYGDHGLVDIINEGDDRIELRVLWSVDRACEQLISIYRNEQLLDKIEVLNKKIEEEVLDKEKVNQSLSLFQAEPAKIPLSSHIADYRLSTSLEDLINRFISTQPDISCIFFKYLPSVHAFVATHSSQIFSADLKGVGCHLQQDEIKELQTDLSTGKIPLSLENVLVQGFHFDQAKVLPLYVQDMLEGIVAYSGSVSEKDSHFLGECFSLFSLAYSHFYLEKKVSVLEVQDFVTSLYNRSYYVRRLNDEIRRALRTRRPVSVVKLSIDHLFDIEQSLGEPARDHLLKSVASLVATSSRAHDLCARTSINEIAMILPDCPMKKAAIRAERVRRAIENANWLENGLKMTVSLGLSEFPSLASDAVSLDGSSSKALSHILDKGGNKLCQFKAPKNFRPEFVVAEEI